MDGSGRTQMARWLAAGGVPVAVAAGSGLSAAKGDFGIADAVRIARDRRAEPIVLTLDLTRPLRPSAPGLAALRTRGRPTLRHVLETLEWAAEDGRVVGLLARVGGRLGGLATTQELMAGVRRFVDTGRPAIAHADVFGEGGNGTLGYVLASAFGEVHLQPTGDLALLGVAGEVTFLRGALDRAGIEPQFGHRHEYKNAVDVLTGHGFTDAHREALDAVVGDWAEQIITAVAAARDLDVSDVRAAMDHAPLSADEAHAAGLVDRLAYLDESLDSLRATVPGDPALVPLERYGSAARARRRWVERHAPRVALIEATGPITVQDVGILPSGGVTSDGLCADLRRAGADDEIAAIVLRVDSPGGSAVASDAIRREIHRVRAAGRPVVAWMGDVAGSGGYFIAMPADRIVAQPGTLTGSIGVIAGKAVRTGLEDRLGIQTEAVTRGAHARYYSSATGFTASERERLDSQLDRVYDDFTAKVAQDRRLTADQVERIARGRIWTGAHAQVHGLVDRLGGYQEALDVTRTALDLPPTAPLRVRRHPRPRSALARLRGDGPPDPAREDIAAILAALPTDPGAWSDVIADLSRTPGMLSMPWIPRLR
jgi:protease-4